jgi:hypothetical protein
MVVLISLWPSDIVTSLFNFGQFIVIIINRPRIYGGIVIRIWFTQVIYRNLQYIGDFAKRFYGQIRFAAFDLTQLLP